jgi:NAD(P)-dependent dehydrogenase (short-subunit alcohol dehydrogenase family)
MSKLNVVSYQLPAVVVVTGASSGLGEDICQMLLNSGVSTLGIDISGPLPGLAAHSGYTHVTGDVSEEETWAQVLNDLSKNDHTSYGLVTSAAILHVGSLLETSKADIERSLRINVTGTALAMKAMLPLMIDTGGGPVVAIASIDATFAEQQLATYCATKGAVRQLARTVAMDHARQGIRVNVLSPGPMMAGLFKRHMSSAVDPAKFESTRAQRQPSGKILDAAEVASAALFLLSTGSSAINGAEVMADGGLTTSFDFRTGTEGASI